MADSGVAVFSSIYGRGLRHLPSDSNGYVFLHLDYMLIVDVNTPPHGCIEELNTGKPDINAGSGGKYVWLLPKGTDNREQAGNYLHIQITEDAIQGRNDLAAGADGQFRYLRVLLDEQGRVKITKVALYRKSNGEGKVTLDDAARFGFNRGSTNINEGRDGDYLHLIYSVSN
ncbi:hypothetical protein BDN72DRAFT_963364 [Pluteus cervinus]|uniref:Uncharacterized protein n=1 Tax=Pluteus cervinus TaxID=181527 RepID=A0ACD3AF40_9AGAR|nr:hypothetical protein BDN72DRAFT_963364 [Pluteus cervinus]